MKPQQQDINPFLRQSVPAPLLHHPTNHTRLHQPNCNRPSPLNQLSDPQKQPHVPTTPQHRNEMRQTSKPPTPLLVKSPARRNVPDRQSISTVEVRGDISVQFCAHDG